MSSGKSGGIKWLVGGLLVGGAFLVLAMRDLSVVDVLRELRGTSPTLAGLAVIATMAFMLLKAWRWSMILRPEIRADLPLLHSSVYMGSAANLVIVHSGELLRAMLVSRRANAAPSAVLASIGIERIFDMIAVFSMVGVLLLFDPRLPRAVHMAAVMAGAFVGIAVLLVALLMAPGLEGSTLRRGVTRLIPKALRNWIIGEVKRGLAGLRVVQRPVALLWIYALSMLQWGCIVAAVWLSVAAVGHPVTMAGAIGVWVLMVVGLTLPSSPAQLGTTQLAFTVGLALAAAQDAVAFAASLVYTSTVNVPIMIVGAALWVVTDKSDLLPRGPRRVATEAGVVQS
jgi:glycosyltransferase 2 family protein